MSNLWTKPRFRMLLGATAFLVVFFLFAWWISDILEGIAETTNPPPPSFWWWVLGIAVTTVIIVALWKNRTTLGYSRKKIRFKWILWPAAIVGAIVLANLFEEKVEREMKGYLADKNLGRLPIFARNAPVSPEATLAIIAECESGGRQFDKDGDLIVHAKSGAIGKYQILPSWHEENAEKLGLDIRTEEGNEAFAKVLFEKFGTEPWEASRKCWGNKVVASYAKTFSGTTIATGIIRVGRSWTDWVRIPAGQELYIERMRQVAYEMEIQNGEIFEFPRDFRGHERIPLLQKARFRVMDEEVEELPIWLRFSEFREP